MDAITNFFAQRILPWLLVLLQCLFPFFFPEFSPKTGAGSAEPVYSIVEEDGVHLAEFTLLTYNVKNCQNGMAIKKIAAEIADTGAQIVFLQEIDYRIIRSFWFDEAKRLAAELGFSYAFFPAMRAAGGLYGTAILSAFPLSDVAVTQLPAIDSIEPRALGQADITVEGVPVRLFVTHLSHDDAVSRAEQFVELDRAINAAPGNSFLMGGDFNVASYDDYTLLNNVILAHDTATPGLRQCDNILCDTAKTLGNVRSIPTGYSDHDLVLAEVSIPLD